MSDVVITVDMGSELYAALLAAANEAGVSPADFASAIVANYMEDNYGAV